jgi:hypothetical protein
VGAPTWGPPGTHVREAPQEEPALLEEQLGVAAHLPTPAALLAADAGGGEVPMTAHCLAAAAAAAAAGAAAGEGAVHTPAAHHPA